MINIIYYLSVLKNVIINLLVLFTLSSTTLLAQIEKPVSWTFQTKQINSSEYDLIFNAKLDSSWHIYSSQIHEDAGPIPTTINLDSSDSYELINGFEELDKPTITFDKFFNTTISWFSNQASFKQRISLTNGSASVTGYIEYMACNDEKCLPPTNEYFSFAINKNLPTNTISNNSNALYIFIAGFIAGLLGLLSPCIYSMIPIVIGYFSKHKKEGAIKYSLLYSLFILFIYLFLGIIITLLFGSAALNNLATNIYFNLAFFIIFILFALSFFGDFEIRLPNFLINKTDKLSSRKNIIGIFFMAFTLVLVSFSCTVPILGTLLVQISLENNLLASGAGVLGFALSVALPFGLLAVFPQILLNMPKAGSWMQTIKVALGFLELALALKFLSNADLAYHLNILNRDTFISLWIIIFLSLGLYLLGILKIGHFENKCISGFRLIIAMLSLSFSLYMVPGLFGAKLQMISEFLPPISTQKFNIESKKMTVTTNKTDSKKYADKLFFTPEINSFFDYQEALNYAKNVHKPIFINFTGHACINCRKMETTVFTNQNIINILNNDFIVVSLYVDDRTQLNDSNVFNENNKPIKTIGQLNSYIQITKFGTNSQPYYAIIDSTETLINAPMAFNTDTTKFISFLNEALSKFNKK